MGKRAGGKTRQAEGMARAKEQRQRAVCLSGAACPADCGEGDHMYDEARQVDEGHRRSERDFDFTQYVIESHCELKTKFCLHFGKVSLALLRTVC